MVEAFLLSAGSGWVGRVLKMMELKESLNSIHMSLTFPASTGHHAAQAVGKFMSGVRSMTCACVILYRRPRLQRQNECACSTDLWFERESTTNAPLQSPNSHLLPQYFSCWIRYVMEEVRRNDFWKRQPYLFRFGLIHAKRKQTMGILKCRHFAE